jgi:chaperonin GroES
VSELIAINSKIIVRKIEIEMKSKTGLVISSSNDDLQPQKPTKGEVLYVGTGYVKDDGTVKPLNVKKGDIVFFTPFASNPIKMETEELLAIDERDVLAIMRD